MATFIWRRRGWITITLSAIVAVGFILSELRFSPALATSSGDPYTAPQVVDTNPDPNIVETTITAIAAGVDVGRKDYLGNPLMASVLTFNGTIPGPEFHLKVGDTVIVHFENQLAHHTGIHWHGIELNNASDGTPLTQDQVAPVPPGGKFLYKFKISRPGIYWYHPHHHSSTNQVFKGLYGAIIVTDPNEAPLIASGVIPGASQTYTLALSDITVCDAAGHNPAENYANPADPFVPPYVTGADLPAQPGQNPFTLCEDSPIDEDGAARPDFAAGDVPNIQKAAPDFSPTNEGQTVITNGINVGGRAGTPLFGLPVPAAPGPGALDAGAHTIPVAPGQGVRLRIGNTATIRFFRLLLADNNGVQIPLARIGGQGGLLNEAVIEGNPASLPMGAFDFKYTLGEVLLDPGDRADVVFAVPATATGVLTLWTQDFDRTGGGFAKIPTVPVAHFQVTGSAVPQYTIANGTDLRLATGNPVEVLGSPTGPGILNPADFSKDGIFSSDIQLTAVGGTSLGIDGKQGHHDPAPDFMTADHELSARYAAKLGDILELTVTNTTNAHHPFHLHGFSIQPITLTKAGSGTYTFPPDFRDNVDVPKGYTLKFRVRLDDRPLMDGVTPGGGLGRWVFHCHIFFHATFGMISEFVVTDENGNERPYIAADGVLVQVAHPGDPLAMTGRFYDRDGDPVTLSATQGTITDNGDGTWSWTHNATTSGLVYVTATSGTAPDEKRDQVAFMVQVGNPPVVTVQSPVSGNEGSAVAIHGTVVDPDGDPVTHTWSYAAASGVDAGASCTIADPSALDTTITCTDDGTYTITLTATDNINPPVAQSGTLNVSNVPPTLSITSPASWSPFIMGSTVTVTASITDPGTNDTLSCHFDWDGGGAPSDAAAVGTTCSKSNTFASPGIFTVTVTGSDDDGGSDSETVVIAIFDPNSKASIAGYIISPPGAVVALPAITGKGHFNANPKYPDEAIVPSGLAKFKLQEAGFDFDVTASEFLVVAGPLGQIRGSGRVNGGGSYGFLITFVDGQVAGGGGADKYRLKVWNKLAGDAVVYDNVAGAPEDMDLANPQVAEGGNITIHK